MRWRPSAPTNRNSRACCARSRRFSKSLADEPRRRVRERHRAAELRIASHAGAAECRSRNSIQRAIHHALVRGNHHAFASHIADRAAHWPARRCAQAAAESSRQQNAHPPSDEELALAAMEGLMAQPPERALPIIKKVLAGSQTTLVKQRALFVLSQIDSPEAAARSCCRRPARRMPPCAAKPFAASASAGTRRSLDALAGHLQRRRRRREGGSAAGLDDRRAQGGGVPGSAQCQDGGRSGRGDPHAGRDGRNRRAAQARRPAERLERTGGRVRDQRRSRRACARSPRAAASRPCASKPSARSASSSSDAARAALREIYSRSTDAEIKDAALQGMLIAGDEQGVLALYRAAKTTEEKRALLRTLTMMDGDAALQAIDAALEEEVMNIHESFAPPRCACAGLALAPPGSLGRARRCRATAGRAGRSRPSKARRTGVAGAAGTIAMHRGRPVGSTTTAASFGSRDHATTDAVRVYARTAGGKVERLRVLSATCPVETATPIRDLGNVAADDSARWLIDLVKQRRRGCRQRRDDGDDVLAALAMHRGDVAHERVGCHRPRRGSRRDSQEGGLLARPCCAVSRAPRSRPP